MTADLHAEARIIAQRRPDAIAVLSAAERREALLRLAELAVAEALPADELPSIVHRLADASGCMVAFTDLCDAVRELSAFNDSPMGYADTHDWNTDARALDYLSDRLAADVDAALARLVGGA